MPKKTRELTMDPFKGALGLDQSASREEIMRAYRKLALQFHPDKHTHSPASIREAATLRFKFVSQAYEALLDELKRSSSDNNSSNNEYYTSSRPDYHSSSSSNNNNEHHSSSSSNNNNNKRSSNNYNYYYYDSSSSSNNNNKRSSNKYNYYYYYYDNGRRSYSRTGFLSNLDMLIWRHWQLFYFIPPILVGGILAIDYGYRKMNRGIQKSDEDYKLESKERAKAASAAKYSGKMQDTNGVMSTFAFLGTAFGIVIIGMSIGMSP